MKIRIHLCPSSLKKKAQLRSELEKGHAKASAEASAAGKEPPAPLPPFVLDEAAFEGFSGRVVVMESLGLPECEAADASARGQMTENKNFFDFDAMRSQARLFRSVVGVSDKYIDPRQAMAATIRSVTEADLEGLSMKPGEGGKGTSTGLAFHELFTNKDKRVLKAQDQKWHEVPQDDLEAILGNAIPAAD